MRNQLRHVRVPGSLTALQRLRTNHVGSQDNSLRLRDLLLGTELVPMAVGSTALSVVEVEDHALKEAAIRFKKYSDPARTTMKEVSNDLVTMAKTGYVIKATSPGRKGASEDRVITHEFPVWDSIQLIVACESGKDAWSGKLITVEHSPFGKPPSARGVREPEAKLPRCETQSYIHSLRAQLAVLETAHSLPTITLAVTTLGHEFLAFEHSNGARGWGYGVQNLDTGMMLISSVSAHQILDLLLLHKRYGTVLVEHMRRMVDRYFDPVFRVRAMTNWKAAGAAGKIFGVRVFPPDPRSLDVGLIESLVAREMDRKESHAQQSASRREG